jgi:uridine kinase
MLPTSCCFNNNRRGCFVLGVAGPSGSGKSLLAQTLANHFKGTLFAEDPKFFKAPASASYQDRDPISETPKHVDWDAYVQSLKLVIANKEETTTSTTTNHLLEKDHSPSTILVVVEHFLLLHDPRVVDEMDGILFLDPFGGEDGRDQDQDQDEQQAMQICVNRRVERNPHRSAEEILHLRHYYQHHVWPSYQTYCQDQARALCAERSSTQRARRLGCDGSMSAKAVASHAREIVEEWLDSLSHKF